MIFFINSSFNQSNSGIEHAQLKRAGLFRDHGEPFKMIFREWNPRLHDYLQANGVSDDETLGMFDYFQAAEEVPTKILHAEDIDFGLDQLSYQKEPEQFRYLVLRGQQFVARINYYRDDPTERVSSVEQFDAFGNLYRVDFYDFRGFLSLSQWYTPDNKVGTEVWYKIDGRPVLETFNKYDAKQTFTKTGWRLTEDNGAVYLFSNIDELTVHFYNRLNEQYWNNKRANIFIVDRSHLGDWQLLHLRRPAYTVLHLHNSHAGDAQDPMHSVMNNFYEYGLIHANDYDAIISATEKQTRDVRARFQPKSKLFTIPVGVIPDEQFARPKIAMADRQQGKVIVTARVAPEKRIDHIIEAIGIAKKEVPNISLDVYGYVDHRDNDEAMTKINAAIEKYQLQDVIKLHDYVKDVGAVQREGQVYALASVMEGFNLSLMEAISNGLVGVTYDVNYGPNELIVDGENGFVVPFDDIKAMAAKFVDLFKHPDKLQQMSDRSYELSDRYSEANVWHAWEALLEDAKKKPLPFTEEISSGIGDQRVKDNA